MKWYTASCVRPSKSSTSVFVPSSVSNRYSFSTWTQGSSRRCWAISSPSRVYSFSRARSALWAADHPTRVSSWARSMICLVGSVANVFSPSGSNRPSGLSDALIRCASLPSDDCGRDRQLASSDSLVGDVRGVTVEGSGVAEAHLLFIARLAEESLAGAEHDREDLQPQLVDEVVFHQRAHDLNAGWNDDVSLELVLQPRYFVNHVALEYR